VNRAFATRRIAHIGFAAVLLSLTAGFVIANAQTGAPMEAPATLNAVDFNLVGQANLGAPFQVDSGRLAEKKGGSTAIRNYAHLMVTSHIPVADALTAILQRKNVTPSNTLLHGAHDAMISTLKADNHAVFKLTLVEADLDKLPGDLAADEHVVVGDHRADAAQVDRNIMALSQLVSVVDVAGSFGTPGACAEAITAARSRVIVSNTIPT